MVLGREITISILGSIVAYGTSCSLSVSRSMIDNKNKSTGKWGSSRYGRISYTVSADYLMSTELDYQTLVTAMIVGDPVAISINAGSEVFNGNAIIASISASAPDNDNCTFSIELTGTGELVKV